MTVIAICLSICSTNWSIYCSAYTATFTFCCGLVGNTVSIEWTSHVSTRTCYPTKGFCQKLWIIVSRQVRIYTSVHCFVEIGQIFYKKFYFFGKWFGQFFSSSFSGALEVIKFCRFVRLYPRRMELANILSEWLRHPGKVACVASAKRGGGGGRGEGEREKALPNPPPLFPFLPIPYPLPLSTPATQAKVRGL